MSEEKPQRLEGLARALGFAAALPALQHVARQHGYALAVHGSMATDLDLIACPWVDDAAEGEVLIEALRDCVGGFIYRPEQFPRQKPHGRRCWSIHTSCAATWLDISVMPKTPAVE